MNASPDEVFDFSQYDRNEDGVLERDELAIIMVVPQSIGFGTAHVQVNDADCGAPPLTLDGVRIPLIAEWYTSVRPGDFIVAAHEIAHLALGLDDIYAVPSVTGARRMSLMSAAVDGAYTDTITPHLDAMHKLALGWVTPEIVSRDGVHALMDVKLGDEVLVLPRYRTDRLPHVAGLRGEEYFVLENRQQNLPGLYDTDLLESGIAIWADCSASGYSVRVLAPPANSMQLRIDVP